MQSLPLSSEEGTLYLRTKPESQDHNVALAFLYVPHKPDSGARGDEQSEPQSALDPKRSALSSCSLAADVAAAHAAGGIFYCPSNIAHT